MHKGFGSRRLHLLRINAGSAYMHQVTELRPDGAYTPVDTEAVHEDSPNLLSGESRSGIATAPGQRRKR